MEPPLSVCALSPLQSGDVGAIFAHTGGFRAVSSRPGAGPPLHPFSGCHNLVVGGICSPQSCELVLRSEIF